MVTDSSDGFCYIVPYLCAPLHAGSGGITIQLSFTILHQDMGV